jgi:hypothetical protein
MNEVLNEANEQSIIAKHGEAVQVEAMTPMLKAAGIRRLKL